MDKVLRFISDVLRSRSRANLAMAVVVDIVLSVFIWSVLLGQDFYLNIGGRAVSASNNFPQFTLTIRIVAAMLCILMFFLIWFLLHVTWDNEGDDLYTGLRRKLVGVWQVRYEIRNGAASPRVDRPDQKETICTITIDDETKKLLIGFSNRDHPLFADSESEIIDTAAIRRDDPTRCTLTYYMRRKQAIQSSFGSRILYGPGYLKELEIEIFGYLSFSAPRGAAHVADMSGQWYDLNGNLTRLFSLYAEYSRIPEDDQRAFSKDFYQAAINDRNFSALMGDVAYRRVGNIPEA